MIFFQTICRQERRSISPGKLFIMNYYHTFSAAVHVKWVIMVIIYCKRFSHPSLQRLISAVPTWKLMVLIWLFYLFIDISIFVCQTLSKWITLISISKVMIPLQMREILYPLSQETQLNDIQLLNELD